MVRKSSIGNAEITESTPKQRQEIKGKFIEVYGGEDIIGKVKSPEYFVDMGYWEDSECLRCGKKGQQMFVAPTVGGGGWHFYKCPKCGYMSHFDDEGKFKKPEFGVPVPIDLNYNEGTWRKSRKIVKKHCKSCGRASKVR